MVFSRRFIAFGLIMAVGYGWAARDSWVCQCLAAPAGIDDMAFLKMVKGFNAAMVRLIALVLIMRMRHG